MILSGALFARLKRLADLEVMSPTALALQLLADGLARRGILDADAPLVQSGPGVQARR